MPELTPKYGFIKPSETGLDKADLRVFVGQNMDLIENAIDNINSFDSITVNGDISVTGEILNENVIRPSLQNGWEDYDETYFMPACYWKDKNGVVHLQGLIKGGITDNITTLFVLPEGYRPYRAEIYLQFAYSHNFCRIDVHHSGIVRIVSGGQSWISLAGITFKAQDYREPL